MYELLGKIGYGGIAIIIPLIVISMILLFRFILSANQKKIEGNHDKIPFLLKKHSSIDIGLYKNIISNIGISLSLAIIILAFEMPSYDKSGIVDLGKLDSEIEEQIDIPYYRTASSS